AGTVAGAGCALAAGFGTGAGVGLAAGFATALGLGAGLGLATAAGFFAGAAFLAESAFFAMVFLAFVAFAGFLAAILRSLPGPVRDRVSRTFNAKRGARLYRRRNAGTGQQISPKSRRYACPTQSSTGCSFHIHYRAAREPFLHLRYKGSLHARCDSIRSSWPVSSPSSTRRPSTSPVT